MHEVLINRLGGLSLPRKSVVRLTDRTDMTLDVYRGRKTTMQHQQALLFGVLNYEKQHKEGTCKVSGRSVVFSAFNADFCFCSKSVIITTLSTNINCDNKIQV